MRESRSRLEILELIKNKQVSLEEGMALINNRVDPVIPESSDTPSTVEYYCAEWVEEASVTQHGELTLSGNVLVFDTGLEFCETMRRRFGNRLEQVILVKMGTGFRSAGNQVYEINPVERNDYQLLLAELASQGVTIGKIVHLWSLEQNFATSTSVQAQMEKGILSLFHLTGALMEQRRKHNLELLFLHGTTGSETQPLHAAVSGFAKCVCAENPLFTYRTVEVQNMQDVIDAALRETETNSENLEIRYRDGVRYAKRFNLLEKNFADIEPQFLKEKGVYLITGGVGGLGLIFAEHLAKNYRARLVLAGRSAITPEHFARIQALENWGAEVVYLQADVSKRQDVEQMTAQARQHFGQINGVIHSAGVHRDAFVLKKTMEEVEQVLAPKIHGTLHLDDATKDDSLDFFVMFSSMASITGNVGQSDYAYANAFMDHFAEVRAQRGSNGRTLAINWPLWQEGGMLVDEETKKWMNETSGVVPMRSRNGLQAFEDGLKASVSHLMVIERVARGAERPLKQEDENLVVESNPGDKFVEDKKERYQEQAEAYVKSIFAKSIKLPSERIDSREPLETYGIDSTMIMSLNRELERHFGSLSKTLLFEYQTIMELTEYLIENHQAKLIEKIGWVDKPRQEVAVAVATPAAMPAHTDRHRFTRIPSAAPVAPSMQESHAQRDDIAIIGLNGRFPQADDLDQFWANLQNGLDCITEIPLDRWDHRKYFDPEKDKPAKTYSKWGGFLRDVDKFDSLFFSISPMEAETLDPQERLFLEVVHHALEDSGYTRSSLEGSNVGVFVGVMYGQYQLLHTDWEGHLMSPASSFSSIANRVSYTYNFQGPSIALDTMCSSSLTSIHLACESIWRGESEVAVAGGVNVTIHPTKYLHLSLKHFISSDGRCRTFGVGGDGYVPGEGVGAVILKQLKQAQADGDHIYGVIKGVSVNHGGKTNGYTVPNPKAQRNLITDALKKTGIHPRTISYVEAHGTGTSLGDPIEITGLAKAFQEFTADKQFCSIGSVKTNIGHLESAAGIAGVAKVLLQMKHKQLVPSLHSEQMNPNINFADSPFYVQHQVQEWNQPVVIENGVVKTYPRRAGISAFGAGGSNAHLLLEEYEQPTVLPEQVEPRVFVLSARKEDRLKEYANKLLNFLKKNRTSEQGLRLLDIVYTLQVGRETHEERLATVVSNLEELQQVLQDYCDDKKNIEGLYRGSVRKNKQDAAMVEGREGQEFLKVIMNDRKLAKLARLWVGGVDIEWKLLYDEGEEPKRISLPGYPFAKERFWIHQVDIVMAGRDGESAKLHPLLDRNVSTMREQAYATKFSGSEFYLTDHVVNGHKILPGACFLEMARAAGAMAGEQKVQTIRNVIWAQPVTVGAAPCEVTTSLHAAGDKVSYVISSQNANGSRVVHSEGNLTFEKAWTPVVPETLDIDAILDRCTDVSGGMELYQIFGDFGFQYGPCFQVIREIMGNHTEVLSRLALPEELLAGAANFDLHPSLLDGALQTVGGLMFAQGAAAGRTFLPYALGEVEILGSLPETCYVYAVAQENGSAAVKKFNIWLTDTEGQVRIRIKDYSAREFKQTAGITGSAHPAEDVPQATDDSALLDLLQQIERGTLSSDEADKMMEETYE